MYSADDAKWAVQVAERRKELRETVARLLSDSSGLYAGGGKDVIEIGWVIEEFCAVVHREYLAQIASLDEELRALGVTPEPLEPVNPSPYVEETDEPRG